MNKQFLIQVALDERTRMLCTDEELRRNMQAALQAFFEVWTAGTVPLVTTLNLSDLDLVVGASK